MKFYVPHTDDDAEAELIWATARADLFDRGLPTTRRRIRALSLRSSGRGHLLEIGGETPDGEPVMLILEASNVDVFYVCTPFRGALQGSPYALGLDPPSRAIDFDEEVVGHA